MYALHLFQCLHRCCALLFASDNLAFVALFIRFLPLLSWQEGGAIFQERFATFVFNSFATFGENVAQNVSPLLISIHAYHPPITQRGLCRISSFSFRAVRGSSQTTRVRSGRVGSSKGGPTRTVRI